MLGCAPFQTLRERTVVPDPNAPGCLERLQSAGICLKPRVKELALKQHFRSFRPRCVSLTFPACRGRISLERGCAQFRRRACRSTGRTRRLRGGSGYLSARFGAFSRSKARACGNIAAIALSFRARARCIIGALVERMPRMALHPLEGHDAPLHGAVNLLNELQVFNGFLIGLHPPAFLPPR